MGETVPVRIGVNAAVSRGAFKPIWSYFGADEPNYAYAVHGQKLLGELGELAPNRVFFRTHNLLNTGDGTPALKWGSTGVYAEDAAGAPIYDWGILDLIFDHYLQHGIRPYAQIGFMPEALSIRPQPYQHHWSPGADYNEIYTGWAFPPKDYSKWSELVYQWTKHCVERYGRAEVESWCWEVWNEPNIGYWQGTPAEFYKLHDYAIDAVRRALPTAKVGGPDVAGSGGKFLRDFLEHCIRGTNRATQAIGTPIDFVSFHAKGSPTTVDGHVRMGLANQLRVIDEGFDLISSYPELRNKPVIIGESDPEGCAACQGPALAYRNGTMYSSYTAACLAREYDLAEKYGVNLEGSLTWAFEFEDQPYFAGFRSLASNGLDKPVLNVFRMFSKMRGQRLDVESDATVPLKDILRRGVRDAPDVAALASGDPGGVWVLVWHYHDDDVPGPRAEVELRIHGLPFDHGEATLRHFRIDEKHSNAYSAWQQMGSPQNPTPGQYAALEQAGQLTLLGEPKTVTIRGGTILLQFELPRQGVSLIAFEWRTDEQWSLP